MSVDRLVLLMAGIFILLSVLLAAVHTIYWLWLTAFVGANMAQAALTGFCPMAVLLKKIGVKPGIAFN